MEITIELGRENKNVNPFIEPLGEARRGRWRKANVPPMNLADAELAGLPDLPGYRVAVDTVARKIRVYDPLQDEQRRGPIESALRKFFKRRLEVEPEQVTHDHPQATLQRWLVWMHRLVEAGNATVVGGRIPDDVIQRVAEERNTDAKRAGLPQEVGVE